MATAKHWTTRMRNKQAKRIKKAWMARRKSEAMKAWHEKNRMNGGIHPATGKPYLHSKDFTCASCHGEEKKTSKLAEMFPGKTFKTLTLEERRIYFRTIDKRNTPQKPAIQPLTIELTNQQKIDMMVGRLFTGLVKEMVLSVLKANKK